jgi:hypothetical protein
LVLRVTNQRLPRSRGGVSNFFDAFNKDPKSSPFARGCFPLIAVTVYSDAVFPRPCGGVSDVVKLMFENGRTSTLTRG